MSAPTANSPTKAGAESPTTARPLEMDDDDVPQDSGVLGDAPAKHQATVEDAPPTKPPRPLSPQQQAENTLKEAFPSIDAAVVKAVLHASGGRVEPAFNALLGMSDPDAVVEPTPPPQPARPVASTRMGSTPQSQLDADEQYARQLAEHYGGGYSEVPKSTSRGQPGQPHYNKRQPASGGMPPPREEGDRSFLEDDLPIIRDNLKKGFLETQSTINKWVTNLKKKIDGEDEEDHPQGYSSQYRRSNDGGIGRRSGDYNRYDADPQVLSDDFAGIQMNSDGTPARRSTRPLANPDLFKPTPAAPKGEGRQVSFQGGSPEDTDIYQSSPKFGATTTTKENAPPSSGKQSKWQPLSTVDPSPIGETDNDPFSLGDSEDERESKDRVGGKEIKQDDAERLKKAAAEAMNDNIAEPARKPEPAETVGTQDKTAAEKLKG